MMTNLQFLVFLVLAFINTSAVCSIDRRLKERELNLDEDICYEDE